MKTPTDEQLNEAICRWLGIKSPHECPSCHLYKGQGHTSFCTFKPDHLNDLDAMHEAEKRLTTDQCFAYASALSELRRGKFVHSKDTLAENWIWHATASQRATALARVIAPEIFE